MPEPDNIESLRERSISKLSNDAAFDHVGALIDQSFDAGYERGADRALYLLDELTKRTLLPEQYAVAEYFRANAWSVKESVSGNRLSWQWEHPYHAEQLLALSRAVTHPGFAGLHAVRRCQILTNRANQLSTIGRFIDAIECWDEALGIMPDFALALANRGHGLGHYGSMLANGRQSAICHLHAHDALAAAIAPQSFFDSTYPSEVREQIQAAVLKYTTMLDLEATRSAQDLDGPSLGRSGAERDYRNWCLRNRLFLNPINDLGSHAAAASDDVVLPPISERLGDRPGRFTPPPIVGFFNQLKQEFASARFMLHEGLNSTTDHFSDRGVRLFDTLDFPQHSLSSERVRTAFRVGYSLLDKVAFFIDHFWQLRKDTKQISFRNVWMVEGKPRLLDRFCACPNWPLRGLYWISKELFDEQLKQTTSSDARELHDIRNALEHRYIQVHEGWARSFASTPPAADGLGISIASDVLEAKALRVMKIARSALIHLALAVGVEESSSETDNTDGIVGIMSLTELDQRRRF